MYKQGIRQHDVIHKFGDYIFNSGAQVVLGKATKELAKKLNVTLTLIDKKIIPLSFNNKIIKAQTQIGFLLSLPLESPFMTVFPLLILSRKVKS